MKCDIIIAGVGGQGILSIAAVIGLAAVNNKIYVKQSEVHGMSQRGGAVYSHLRMSDSPIASDLIPLSKADLILSVEPMEALRYIPYLAPDGWIVTNTQPFVNIANYPDIQSLIQKLTSYSNNILLDADALATECGNSKVSNMVVLGAAAPFMNIIGHSETGQNSLSELEKAITSIFERKGETIVAVNIRALKTGYEAAFKTMKL